MKEITVNGKNYILEEGASLKELLQSLGYVFPCGGAGKCGRCKINCKAMKATALDARFLNEKQLVDGVRLVCDKKAEDNYDIAADTKLFGAEQNVRKLTECRIAVVIGIQTINISILDTEIVETVAIDNPLEGFGAYNGLIAAYRAESNKLTKLLVSRIGTECVELFEKYGTAKADTLAVAANDTYLKILTGLPIDANVDDYSRHIEGNLGLPTELVYFLPAVNGLAGGDILLETAMLSENSLLIDCEKICALCYVGKEENVFSAIWDLEYSELELLSVKAAVQTMLSIAGTKPLVFLYGSYKNKISPIAEELGLTHIEKDKNMEYAVRACLSSKTRAKLLKERARSRYVDLCDNESFHEFFSRCE